jgi:hypothetical protein
MAVGGLVMSYITLAISALCWLIFGGFILAFFGLASSASSSDTGF